MSATLPTRIIVVGGAGFIGSHFVDQLLARPETAQVTVYDNFASGREWHLATHASDRRLSIRRADVGDLERLAEAMEGHELVIHLASNPDIARAMVMEYSMSRLGRVNYRESNRSPFFAMTSCLSSAARGDRLMAGTTWVW